MSAPCHHELWCLSPLYAVFINLAGTGAPPLNIMLNNIDIKVLKLRSFSKFYNVIYYSPYYSPNYNPMKPERYSLLSYNTKFAIHKP